MTAGRLSDFYRSYAWKKLRGQVLVKHKHECQDCKARGHYRRADTVHHDRFIDKYPELALSEYWELAGELKMNLIPVCHECHERIHGYRKKRRPKNRPPERW